jgi:hypothetical protein
MTTEMMFISKEYRSNSKMLVQDVWKRECHFLLGISRFINLDRLLANLFGKHEDVHFMWGDYATKDLLQE